MERFFVRLACVASSALLLLASAPAAAQEYVQRYALAPNSAALDLGVQPLSYPNGVIGTVMRHDRILQAELARLGTPLQTHAFKRGADMLTPINEDKLDAGLIGDMPTVVVASTQKVWIVGLAEVSQNAIVFRGGAQVNDVAGKRIGYVPVSTAHSTLIQGLAAARLSASDVTLVPLSIGELPGALARGEIDAMAAWEPAVSQALAANRDNRIVFRSQSVDYFLISRAFEHQSPEAALALVAGYVRAFGWMRQSRGNVEKAARWVLAEGQVLAGAPIQTTVSQVVDMTRSGILNIPSAPVIVMTTVTAPLKAEFDLLASLNQLSAGAKWEHVASSFDYDGLRRVMAQPRYFKVRSFDYAP